ncbi:MAG TPA: flagella basal body P-ring formation protein FlgA [Sphingomonadaceae bacterium]|nr:flagella basal body P-ring formation protein FlgA [Sphingomonadaceae bacterium]
MLGAPLLLAALGAPAAAATVSIDLGGRDVRLADVARLTGFTPAGHPALASRIIASIPPSRTQLSMTRDALAGLVRRNVPGLGSRLLPAAGSVTFRAPAQPRAANVATGVCASTAQAVAKGAALTMADVVVVPCEAAVSAPVRFDRSALALRASAHLPAGTRLGRLALPAAPDIDKGDELTLRSTVGPVSVERQVVALQSGRSGGRVFVRDAEGQVVSAPLSLQREAAR